MHKAVQLDKETVILIVITSITSIISAIATNAFMLLSLSFFVWAA